jgi:acyl-CoA dehydrogenase
VSAPAERVAGRARPWPVERAFVSDAHLAAALAPCEAVAAEAEATEHAAASPGEGLRALVRLFGARGLLRLTAPRSHGGLDETLSSTSLCLARERLGHVSPLADLAFAMQGLGSHPIVLAGSAEARDAWLPRVVRGEAVSAFALTEPEAGSDLGGLATRAVRDGDGYVIDGHKTFISNAGVADVYTVFAVTAPDAPKRRLSAFVVPANAPGLEARPQRVLGGHPIGDLHFHGVRVPAAARLGEEGGGLALALATLHRFRPTVGAAALGFAQRALDETVQHVRTRRQFGAPLAELAVVQSLVAEMACDVETARLLVYRAANAADHAAGHDDRAARAEVARTGSMAKLCATEAAQRVIDRAVQLHGGRGVLVDGIVARLYEEVRSLRIYEGANEVQKLLIAREILGA